MPKMPILPARRSGEVGRALCGALGINPGRRLPNSRVKNIWRSDDRSATFSPKCDQSAVRDIYKFNEAVTLDTNAFTISATSQNVQAPSLSYASPDGGVTWVVTFSGNGVTGNSIANGEYQIVLNSSAVTAVSGGGTLASNDTEKFYRLYGYLLF